MTPRIYAVIMAGGRGERFWPLSTSSHPKQVISLIGNKPMIGLAVDYIKGVCAPADTFVITSADLVGSICKAAPSLKRANVIGEPCGRDTAAVCALASAVVGAKDPDGIICILTADHIINRLETFRSTIKEAATLAAREDVLITIGIQPTFPSTGFGYIEAGAKRKGGGAVDFRKARRFVEKPDLATARKYLKAGHYFWNAGMFVWSVKSFNTALERHAPQLLEMSHRLGRVAGKPSFARRLRDEYSRLQRISVDYAIMEKADNIVMARGAFGWDDVGSWTALENHFPKDRAGNVAVGECEALDAFGNIVVSRDRLTALIGVRDLVVVQADGVTLVCHKDKVQSVKSMVQHLAKTPHKDLL